MVLKLHPIGDSGLSYKKLRDLCDYKDPSTYICGGGCTSFHVVHLAYRGIRRKRP